MRCGARLTTDRLSFGQRFVDLDDITGCLCMKAPPPASGAADSSATASAAYLTVYAYSLVKTGPITFFYRFEEGSEIVHSFHCTRAIVYLTTTPLHFFVWFFFPNLTHLHSFQRRCSSLIVLLLVFCFLFFFNGFPRWFTGVVLFSVSSGRRPIATGSVQRRRQELLLRCDRATSFADNWSRVDEWRRAILRAARPTDLDDPPKVGVLVLRDWRCPLSFSSIRSRPSFLFTASVFRSDLGQGSQLVGTGLTLVLR